MTYQKPSEADYGEYLRELSRIQGMPDTTRAPITRKEIPMGPDGKLIPNARVVETYASEKHRQMLLDNLNKSFEGRFGPGSIADAQRMYRGSEWARKQRENPGPKENMPYRPSAQTMNNFANDDRMRQAEYMKSKRDAESAAARANTPDPRPDVEAPWRTVVIPESKNTPETDFRSQAEKNERELQLQIAKQQKERMAKIGTKGIQIGDQIVNVPKEIFTDYGGSYYGGKFANELDHYYAVQNLLKSPGTNFGQIFLSKATGAYSNPGRAPLEVQYQGRTPESLKQLSDHYGKLVLMKYGSEDQRRAILNPSTASSGKTQPAATQPAATQPTETQPTETQARPTPFRRREIPIIFPDSATPTTGLSAPTPRPTSGAPTPPPSTPTPPPPTPTPPPPTPTLFAGPTSDTPTRSSNTYAGPDISGPGPAAEEPKSIFAGPSNPTTPTKPSPEPPLVSEPNPPRQNPQPPLPRPQPQPPLPRPRRQPGVVTQDMVIRGGPRISPGVRGGSNPYRMGVSGANSFAFSARPNTDPVVTRDSVSSRSPYLRALRTGVPFISR